MSLWKCPDHGLYGGQMFCPKCDKMGGRATLADALRGDTSMVADPFEEMAQRPTDGGSNVTRD